MFSAAKVVIISLNIKYFTIKIFQLGFFCLTLQPNIDTIL